MAKKYITEEIINISFDAIVYYGRERSSFCFKAHILYDQNDICLHAFLSEQNDVAKEKLLEALRTPIKKKDFKICKAYIGDTGNSINLNIPEEIRFTRHDYINGQEVVAMYLKQISFSYEDEANGNIFRLSSICSSMLKAPTEYLVEEGSSIEWISNSTPDRQCFDIPFTLAKYKNHSYIKTGDIENLLTIFSFYHCTRFEYDIAITPAQSGIVKMVIKAPQFKVTSGNSLKTIGYLTSEQKSMGTFSAFLSISKDYKNLLPNNKLLSSYIYNYVRADYLDDVSKLIIYTTILEKMAGVGINDDTHKCIKFYLAKQKISVKKINDTLSNYKFKDELRNEKRYIISNFIQLRNYFVHHLGSEEAELFLRKSEMLFYLKLIITILILYRFGITEIQFKSYFRHLSVFDDCLKIGKFRKAKTTKCRFCRWIKAVVNKVKKYVLLVPIH